MRLSILQGTFAVCKLKPNLRLPAWVPLNNSSDFVSVTKTNDELSIVCRQDYVPMEDTSVIVEQNWCVYKVIGPLDFGMTGVMASLAQPLAQAEISIFAISTYDTDYLLVKTNKLQLATQVLIQAGHEIDDTNSGTAPKDGPSTEFAVDPLVAYLVKKEGPSPVSVFSCPLVMISSWPPSPQLEIPYQRLRLAVEKCWDPSDLLPEGGVYLYPFCYLHVTVATFYRPSFEEQVGTKDNEAHEQWNRRLIRKWANVVEMAQVDHAWPKEPLQLIIDSTQIGKVAGILLWKETTGGMAAMRQCLERAATEQKMQSTMHIPNIVHSTFLRFHKLPSTPGALVQERFRANVIEKLSEIFPEPIVVPTAKFIAERIPYVHIPDDDDHVYATIQLLHS